MGCTGHLRPCDTVYGTVNMPRTVKRFPCGDCDYVAKRKEHLDIHVHRHTGTKPYVCKVVASSCSVVNMNVFPYRLLSTIIPLNVVEQILNVWMRMGPKSLTLYSEQTLRTSYFFTFIKYLDIIMAPQPAIHHEPLSIPVQKRRRRGYWPRG